MNINLCRRAVLFVLIVLTTVAPPGVLSFRAMAAPVPTSKPATRPIPQVEHVVVISIDGLRPDVLLRASTPNIHALFQGGAFTFWAQTIPIAITLPSHTSMMTGVGLEQHGITFNDQQTFIAHGTYPKVPTLFELAHNAGYTTALVSGKGKFAVLARPGTVDWLSLPPGEVGPDSDVADEAVSVITQHRPEVMLIHFPGGDVAGHAKGWASPEQFAAIEQIDQYIGMIVHAIDSSGLRDSTAIIVTADHGGTGKQHGIDDPRTRYIPWIINGPGVRKNFDLTLERKLYVNTTDTFATACFLLNVPIPSNVEGKPVLSAFEKLPTGIELMHESTMATAHAPATTEPAR